MLYGRSLRRERWGGKRIRTPEPETLNKLKEADIELLRTDLNGAVHIAFDGTAYTVETER
jgi:beta-lactamase superfamily II metal-dependent hydrolase